MSEKKLTRLAHVFQVYPDKVKTYIDFHNPIWPELEKTLKAHGAHNYSIFLHEETHQLFAYVEVEDLERWKAVAQTEICQKWWAEMAELMETNPDWSPQAIDLKEIFHLD